MSGLPSPVVTAAAQAYCQNVGVLHAAKLYAVRGRPDPDELIGAQPTVDAARFTVRTMSKRYGPKVMAALAAIYRVYYLQLVADEVQLEIDEQDAALRMGRTP